MNLIENGWLWFGFSLFLVLALSVDTFLLNKKHVGPHRSVRAALLSTAVWIVCAFIFNLLWWVYLRHTQTPVLANQKALEFLTGYLIEKSLSFDNLFVFYLVFNQLHIPSKYQQRIFAYGIWSAIFLRLGIILLGVWLVTKFHWLLYIMGAFLIVMAAKVCMTEDNQKKLSDTWVMKLANKCFRVTDMLEGEHFFVKKGRWWYVTPLFLSLIFIEVSDIIFAFDSIPAIFAITTDPFIVWTSNIFAILGLRSLYFVLANMVQQLHLLKYGIALILAFVGSKMLIAPWLDVPIGLSLGVIVGILCLFSWTSITLGKKHVSH